MTDTIEHLSLAFTLTTSVRVFTSSANDSDIPSVDST